MSTNILLDTSYLIRLLNRNDPLHENCHKFHEKFIERSYQFYISTIAISEYGAGGNIAELPLSSMRIVPFNFDHAKRSSEMARIVKPIRENIERNIVINDIKMFAQADVSKDIAFYASADAKSFKIYDKIKGNLSLNFEFINIRNPYTTELNCLF